MPFLKTSITEPTEYVAIETELGVEWKFQTGPLPPTELRHAELNQTLGPLTLLATGGAPVIHGDLSQTLGGLTLAATGTGGIAGNLSKTLGNLSLAGTGATGVAADLGKTLGALTLSAGGTAAGLGALLLEDGTSFLLTESSDHILLE